MRSYTKLFAAAALSLLAAATVAFAERVPSYKAQGQKSTGAKPDISVPYTTNGSSTLGAYSVGPRIYSSPSVDDPNNPQARKVYNLPFYGATMSYGDKSNGAVSKPK
jgi:hypothetical protein